MQFKPADYSVRDSGVRITFPESKQPKTEIAASPPQITVKLILTTEPVLDVNQEAVTYQPVMLQPSTDEEFRRAAFNEPRPNAYVEYERRYTAEGGIAITYQDVDDSLKLKIIKVVMWVVLMSCSIAFTCYTWDRHSDCGNTVYLILLGCFLAWMLSRPDYVSKTVEIRTDCMIIDGEDVFWLSQMELGLPTFSKITEGRWVLAGVYGTRWVEYLSVTAIDELDRGPQVLASHLSDAMQKLWLTQVK